VQFDARAEQAHPTVVVVVDGSFAVLDVGVEVGAREEGEAGFLWIVLDADAGGGFAALKARVDPAGLLMTCRSRSPPARDTSSFAKAAPDPGQA
jgi:hypothetical protein